MEHGLNWEKYNALCVELPEASRLAVKKIEHFSISEELNTAQFPWTIKMCISAQQLISDLHVEEPHLNLFLFKCHKALLMTTSLHYYAWKTECEQSIFS